MKRTLIGVSAVSAATALFALAWYGLFDYSPRPAGRGSSAPRARPQPPSGTLRLFAHAGGRGLEGVRFSLTGEKGGSPRSFPSRPDGTCSVPRLAPGEWTVAARHPRFLPAEGRVLVEEGAEAELALELNEGGRVSGTVTDAAGRPLPRIAVSVIHGETRNPLNPPLNARTDASGRYRIEGIPLLELCLHFHSDRHKPFLKEGLLFRYPGDAHEVNAALEEGATVSGRVTDETGAPIRGAAVTAGNERASAARTDAEGRFAIGGLGEGEVNLSARARGYGTGFLRGAKPGTSGLEIRLPKAGRVRGRAVADAPLPDFAVILSRFDPDFGRELRVETRTFPASSGGEFAIEDVAPGTYRVEIEARGFQAVERPEVTVAPGQASAEVRVRLRKSD